MKKNFKNKKVCSSCNCINDVYGVNFTLALRNFFGFFVTARLAILEISLKKAVERCKEGETERKEKKRRGKKGKNEQEKKRGRKERK